MPENKKEANVDVIKSLAEFKSGKLSALHSEIAREKSKVNVLVATIRASKAKSPPTKKRNNSLKRKLSLNLKRRKRLRSSSKRTPQKRLSRKSRLNLPWRQKLRSSRS